MNISFVFDGPPSYTGGVNFYLNVISSLKLVIPEYDNIILFVPSDISDEAFARFTDVCCTYKCAFLTRYKLSWFLHKFIYRLFGFQPYLSFILRKYKSDILMCYWWPICKKNKSYSLISWIPDLQNIHLPKYFPGNTAQKQSERFLSLIYHSDLVLSNSQSVKSDLCSLLQYSHDLTCKIAVTPFASFPVTQPAELYENYCIIRKKYTLPKQYIFLPNQFWQHKNHLVVVTAVEHYVQTTGNAIYIVLTGHNTDFRLGNQSAFDSFNQLVASKKLDKYFFYLGHVPYVEMQALALESSAIINPSFFEGWSTTVEEARYLDRPIILSSIPVHKEQSPPQSFFFQPTDFTTLSLHFESILSLSPKRYSLSDLEYLNNLQLDRCKHYGYELLKLVNTARSSII